MTTLADPPPDTPPSQPGSWSGLVSAALVGTARRPVPPPPAGPGDADRTDPALTLLDRAALAAVHARAGRLPARSGAQDPGGFDPAPPETAPPAPPRAARRLADLLLGDSPLLLQEWLELAAQAGVRVPPEWLPDLLDRCGRAPRRLGRALLPVAGRRGLWLAGLDSGWAYLRLLAEAAEFTAEQWRARPAQERHALLEAREPHLTPADEPLLEEAVGDRSTRVRGLAMALLAQLPGTERGRLLADYARRHLRRGSDGTPEIRLPDLSDPRFLRALGARPRAEQIRGAETRREWLWTLISHAPLRTWCGHLGADPGEVAGFAAAHDDELLQAIANAAVLQRDRDWARALLPIVLERLTDTHDVRASRGPALLALLPPDEQCAWALERATRLRSGRRGDTPGALLPIAEALDCPWSREFGAVVADALAAARRGDTSAGRLCRVAATRMPPSLHPRAAAAAHSSELGESGRKALSELAETLRYRSEMHEEFR
ncbi:hypothetical protein FZ103_19620 [Streptomonospora sp. PA3]|uniref:DUF5691 domain-containing protein n=1 Tax=Streptomonospora sp. PA3 TaxID=2607326 RepID=UPI0012DBE4CF|nr:DUF5691 domain-containing protein [Streptomonospora sp. PA3]MUL43349.1 hypothetical protein [Streptomonospora sp. PA3]